MDAIAVISGTNGKTTTTHLLDQILEANGRNVITNRSGANLSQSITTTVIDSATRASSRGRTDGVLECDEFALSTLTAQFKPNVIVLTNLFRDQLDRYTEIDEIERRWTKVLERLPNTTVVAPADDPRLAWLASHAPGGFLLYGVRTSATDADDMGLTHDAEDCPSCGSSLDYGWHTIGHLGFIPLPLMRLLPSVAMARTRDRRIARLRRPDDPVDLAGRSGDRVAQDPLARNGKRLQHRGGGLRRPRARRGPTRGHRLGVGGVQRLGPL